MQDPANVPVVSQAVATLEAQVTEVSRAVLPDWPTRGELAVCKAGELWVSKDLAVWYHPQSLWVDGRPLYAHDFTSRDPIAGVERIRVYRRLDRDWYVWLYRAAKQAKASVTPEVWDAIAARMNWLWAIVSRWWGSDQVAALHGNPILDARYAPPVVAGRRL